MMEVVLLMLLLVGQLRFTVAASDVIEVRNELRLLQNNINILWKNILREERNETIGPFQHRPNTTIISNKLHELQNNVTKLTEDLTNSNQNVDAINVRIVEFGTQLENLKRLYDNEIREFRQSLGTFQFSLFQLMHEYGEKQNREQQLTKINLEQDEIEIIEAFKHKSYKFAAVKFLNMKNESIATELIRKVYRQLDNVDCLLNFADNLKNNMNKTLLVYRTLSEELGDFNLIEICKLFKTRMKLYYDIKYKKMTSDSMNAAKKLLTVFDERIELWLYFSTVWLQQDLIVKIKLHNGLYMPASYVYKVNDRLIDVQLYRRSGRRTAVLSCYPIDCS